MSNIYDFIAREFGEKESVNIVEIGGHIGTDTVLLSKFVGNGKMVVFEPDPRNIPIIQSRINGLNIELALLAIGSENGEAEFHLSSGVPPYEDNHISETQQHTASSSLKAPKNHLKRFPWVKFDSVVKVNTTTLDSYFKDLSSPIDFMWADVQGAEMELILGGKNTLSMTKFLYTEFNNNEMYEGQKDFEKLMKELPGEWGLVRRFGDEILLQNKSFGTEWCCDSHAQECWDERYLSNPKSAKEQSQFLARDFLSNAKNNHDFFDVIARAKTCFEIGCGLGELANQIQPLYNIRKVVAIDCSKVAIKMASETYKNCEFKVHDARFSFNSDEKFDYAIASNVLQLFKNPFILIDNMLDVANNCIIITPYKQALTDGYTDEGGLGHVFSFDDDTFNKYNVIAKMTYTSEGWQHSSAGESPVLLAVLIRRNNEKVQ